MEVAQSGPPCGMEFTIAAGSASIVSRSDTPKIAHLKALPPKLDFFHLSFIMISSKAVSVGPWTPFTAAVMMPRISCYPADAGSL